MEAFLLFAFVARERLPTFQKLVPQVPALPGALERCRNLLFSAGAVSGAAAHSWDVGNCNDERSGVSSSICRQKNLSSCVLSKFSSKGNFHSAVSSSICRQKILSGCVFSMFSSKRKLPFCVKCKFAQQISQLKYLHSAKKKYLFPAKITHNIA